MIPKHKESALQISTPFSQQVGSEFALYMTLIFNTLF